MNEKIESARSLSAATIMEYKPKDFAAITPAAALDYLIQKKQGSDFLMSDVLRETTGVAEIERQSEQQKIEDLALEKVALIQEQAYTQGFDLGKTEGRKEAFEKGSSEINTGLEQIQIMLQKLGQIKTELIHQNETHIMTMIYKIAEKLAFDHIESKPEVILSVIQKSIETAQADEDITVSVAPEQMQFLENMKLQNNREFEFLKNIKLQSVASIEAGGCIVETNYGVIDARIPERTSKLWDEIKQALPKVKNKVG
jgi:flagellar assembly protein FliH